jgi:hypothetical protein
MITVHYCGSVEFREKATQIVLETLACLPETLRKIFVWSHYRGCSVNQIAGMLDWRAPEIEAALYAISSTLYQRTRGLLVQDSGVPDTLQGMGSDSGKSGTSEPRFCALDAQLCWTTEPRIDQGSEPATFWP